MSTPVLTRADVARAQAFATTAHAGQVDKAGNPYIEHPAEVADRVRDQAPAVQIVAWLHDVVEDTPATLAEVEAHFGPEVRDGVDAMTHRKGETNADYYARVLPNPIALLVKAADLADNTDPMRTRLLPKDLRDRLAAKYAKAYGALRLPVPARLVPEGRIPVNIGDVIGRGHDKAIVAWVGQGPTDAVLVFTQCAPGDGAWRGTAATPGTLVYIGDNDGTAHLYAVSDLWTVTDPMWA